MTHAPSSIRATGIMLMALLVTGFCSCEKSPEKRNSENIESFCVALPEGWSCEVFQGSFETLPVPEGDQGRLEDPLAIIKYTNSSIECSDSDPIWLQVYDISKKEELEIIIDNSRIYSWCIPIFFGENGSYYVITSPCYLYTGCWTIDSIVHPFLQALKVLFTKSIME